MHPFSSFVVLFEFYSIILLDSHDPYGQWSARGSVMMTHSPELSDVQLGLGVWGVTVGIREFGSSIPMIPVYPF